MFLALVVLFLPVFDFFALGVAAPVVQHDLTGGSRGAELVPASFSFGYAAGLLAGGVLGDRFGARRLIAAGACGYLAACVVCASAPTAAVLLGGRLVQGVSAAAMVAQGFVLIWRGGSRAYPLMAATLGAAAACGQLLGGLPVGWRWLFLVEIAVGLLIVCRLPDGGPVAGNRVDAAGVVLGVLLPLSVLGPLAWLRLAGGTAWVLAAAIAVVPLGWGYHRRLRVMAGRRRRLVFAGWRPLLAAAGTGGVYAGQAVLILVVSLRPDPPGLFFYGVSFALVSLMGPRLPSRSWVAGPALAGAGLALLYASADPRIPLVLCGAAMGLTLPALTAAALAGSAPGAVSRAAGTLATMQQFAAAAALTAVGLLLDHGRI
ncbi:MFS transporter [Catenuloplanes atrovinosus]|uniref:MFS family permease n=1 Tax=Catenuloplanes atrovinosus TaxID=137266 RepID=A0AAE4CBP3_9ACTN|nr:MFS transporter [Catenuloplanes atrovinosus]MDR7277139.1 MFS family permease [Catenuloplanes atrovinosus]